jgi:ubiquinone/menaquinone biosynthesis C-methylase UbiE
VADASVALPFRSEQFDVVFSHNVLESITGKEALLNEVHRILRRWGQVLFAHFDWDSQLVNGIDKNLVRKILQAYADWKQAWMTDHDAWMGRRLWGTFQRNGLFEGDVYSYVLTNTKFEPGYYGTERIKEFQALVPAGFIDQQEYDAFYQGVEALARRGEYFYSITTYIYVGRRP